jgi:hypothetical protein
MTASTASKPAATIRELLRRRLGEIGRSADELAQAIGVPAQYIDDLMTGARRPPLPGRTDIYGKMTSFLQLGRHDVVECARAERAASAPARATEPGAQVRSLLLALCEPGTALELERRRTQHGGAELAGLAQRLLDIAQGAVQRELGDQISLRVAALKRGETYLELRVKVLEFQDATADTVTVDGLIEFLQPRIARWDVDFTTGVLRVVLQAPAQSARRLNTPESEERS